VKLLLCNTRNEHSRIFRFENGGKPEIYLASADWTARNFFRRVEICFPVDDPELHKRVDEVVATYWADNVKAREQGTEPIYIRRPLEGEPITAQVIFLERALKPKKPDTDVRSRMAKTKGSGKRTPHEQRVGQPARGGKVRISDFGLRIWEDFYDNEQTIH